MPETRGALDQTGELSRRETTHLPPHNNGTCPCASEPYEKASSFDLFRPREQLEECRCIDDIHLVQEVAPIGARIVDVFNDEGRFEPAAFHEEVISDVYQ